MSSRIIVGISGASCSGKTTLAKLLKATFPWATTVHQDAYYYPNEPKYHVYLPDVKHFNWDLKSAVNFPKLESDLHKVLEKQTEGARLDQDEKLLCFPNDAFVEKHRPSKLETNYLIQHFSRIPLTILEGHILFSQPNLYNLCTLKYFLTLDQAELFSRRRLRTYNPPNPPGYLEKYVWPAYLSRLKDIKDLPDIQYFDAKTVPLLDMYHDMKQSIALTLGSMTSPEPAAPYEESPANKMKLDQKG